MSVRPLPHRVDFRLKCSLSCFWNVEMPSLVQVQVCKYESKQLCKDAKLEVCNLQGHENHKSKFRFINESCENKWYESHKCCVSIRILDNNDTTTLNANGCILY